MFNLTKHERLIVVFLIFVTLVGVSISYYKKITKKADFGIVNFDNKKVLSQEAKSININNSNEEGFDSLPGIGPSLAVAIVDYRNLNGPFKTAEDLMRIKGIGPKKFDKIKEFLVLE